MKTIAPQFDMPGMAGAFNLAGETLRQAEPKPAARPDTGTASLFATCKTCRAEIDVLAVFPGGICLRCHEIKFNAEVSRSGGILPRPDFRKVFNRR